METTAAFGQMRLFVYPPQVGDQTGVTLSIVEPMPPADGTSFALDSHGLALHLGRPVPVRQRREDTSRAWTFTRGDLTLLPAGCRTTMWTEAPAHYMAINLGAELVRQAAGLSGREVEMPSLFTFDDPLCRELSLSMAAEAEAHGAAARLYVESAAVVVAQRLVLRGVGRVTPRPRPGLPPAVLRRAKEFLHDRMNRNPGITELSAAVGMSVDHFSRMFKRSTGLAAPSISLRHPPGTRQAPAGRGAHAHHRDRVRDRLREPQPVFRLLSQAHRPFAERLPAAAAWRHGWLRAS